MSHDPREKLIRMANQIGEALAVQGEAKAAEATAAHLRKFWTPKMIADLLAATAGGSEGLRGPAARAAKALGEPR